MSTTTEEPTVDLSVDPMDSLDADVAEMNQQEATRNTEPAATEPAATEPAATEPANWEQQYSELEQKTTRREKNTINPLPRQHRQKLMTLGKMMRRISLLKLTPMLKKLPTWRSSFLK